MYYMIHHEIYDIILKLIFVLTRHKYIFYTELRDKGICQIVKTYLLL